MLTVDWDQLDLVVFDVDGTLYDQRRLRRKMMGLLLRHLVVHPGDFELIRTISTFRRCREQLSDEESGNVARLQYERPAKILGVESQQVEDRVRPWFEEKPLSVLRRCRYHQVELVFDLIRRRGLKIAALSDYPAEAKVRAMNLEADFYACGTDPEIDRFKPHPAGLAHVLESLDVDTRRCLLIGDRDDRDGECARRLGVSYLIRTETQPTRPVEFRTYGQLLDSCA